ncbi:CotD family spore coat protein [Pseudalkalibacillus sp. SCS-8]|uniref:CotD family spore coat protein n=1 Tax=Pseudalkalibacillus nanhaiensis TaxID=3115291 RepID=UPI0032DBC573
MHYKKPQMMCPVVHPPKKCVKHFCHYKVVPHIHPVIEEHVHHNIYEHKHMQKHCTKSCCKTHHKHCMVPPKCGCQHGGGYDGGHGGYGGYGQGPGPGWGW